MALVGFVIGFAAGTFVWWKWGDGLQAWIDARRKRV